MRYGILLLFLLTSCQITSITPESSGVGLDISVDWSRDTIRHGLTYLGTQSKTEVHELDQDSIKRGKNIYLMHCEKCHGANGKGGGELAKTLKITPADLSNISRKAHKPLLVMVIKRGKDSMPQWENILSNKQSVDVTNYILTLGQR